MIIEITVHGRKRSWRCRGRQWGDLFVIEKASLSWWDRLVLGAGLMKAGFRLEGKGRFVGPYVIEIK